MTHALTVNDPGELFKFFTFLGGALIGEGRLLERGAYFEILKNRNSGIFICVLQLIITLLYLKNTEFLT